VIDSVIADYRKPADLIGENGLLKQSTQSIFEAALKEEIAEHLGHDKQALVGNAVGNDHSGLSTKTITGKFGALDIEIPRERVGTFRPS
jgi:putative transposase